MAMPQNTPVSYSLFPKDTEHEMPDLTHLPRPGSSRSAERSLGITAKATYAYMSKPTRTATYPPPTEGKPEVCYVKMVEIEHKRAHSEPPRVRGSHQSSFSRLRKSISTEISQNPLVTHARRHTEKKSSAQTHESMKASIKRVDIAKELPAPPPAESSSPNLRNPSPQFLHAPHAERSGPLLSPLPPSYLSQTPHVPRPLSTLEEEDTPVEPPQSLLEASLLPISHLTSTKPWTSAAIESPTRAQVNAVAPPPLKLRAPIRDSTATLAPLTLTIPPKTQRLVPPPEPKSPLPPPPPVPSGPRAKKQVRFVATAPEIITPASTLAATRHRAENPRPRPATHRSAMQKPRNTWSTVFLLSAPESDAGPDQRPSTSPGPRPPQHHPQTTKSILRRSSSFQNLQPGADADADAEDSDVEIKPLEPHVHQIIHAAMAKNLKRLPRSKHHAAARKNTPLPALPALAETPPTPTSTHHRAHPVRIPASDRRERAPRHAPGPVAPPSPPSPLFSRRPRFPVVVNHAASPPSSASSSRDGSPDSMRSSSSEREGSGVIKVWAVGGPTRRGREEVEVRVGRARGTEHVAWRAVA